MCVEYISIFEIALEDDRFIMVWRSEDASERWIEEDCEIMVSDRLSNRVSCEKIFSGITYVGVVISFFLNLFSLFLAKS